MKKINIYVVVTLVLLITSGLDIVKQIVSTKNYSNIFDKRKYGDEDSYDFFLLTIVNIFMLRLKILTKKDFMTIKDLVDVYISLFYKELKSFYDFNKTTFNNYLKSIEGDNNIYIFRNKEVKYISYDIEYCDNRSEVYKKNIREKYSKSKMIEEEENSLIDFFNKIMSHDELLKSKDYINKINTILEDSTFPKLYWESEEIKLRPKELDKIFIINLENSNKFIDIDNSLSSSKIKIIGDHIYSFFNFGDPFPFIRKISTKHLYKILDALLKLIIYFFPEYNIPSDIRPYLNLPKTVDRIYVYYLYYTIFDFLTDGNLYKFIRDNKDKILKLYIQENNKFYDI